MFNIFSKKHQSDQTPSVYSQGLDWFMVFNATFNNISLYRGCQFYWWNNGLTGENYWPVASYWQTLSHNVVSRTPRHIHKEKALFAAASVIFVTYKTYLLSSLPCFCSTDKRPFCCLLWNDWIDTSDGGLLVPRVSSTQCFSVDFEY
jgi:hypothetical protein